MLNAIAWNLSKWTGIIKNLDGACHLRLIAIIHHRICLNKQELLKSLDDACSLRLNAMILHRICLNEQELLKGLHDVCHVRLNDITCHGICLNVINKSWCYLPFKAYYYHASWNLFKWQGFLMIFRYPIEHRAFYRLHS